MSVFKKILVTISTIVLIVNCFSIVYADNGYEVADASDGFLKTIEVFNDYYSANNFYLYNLDNYDNLVLIDNNKIIDMEYGIVKINNSSDINTEYLSINNGKTSINSGYAIDAAYLNKTNNEVIFKLAGDVGRINIEEVELLPYETIEVRLSGYATDNNTLFHDIKTDLDEDYYTYNIEIDDKPDYLGSNTFYYSYDGHYFYDNFYLMIDDYRNNVFINAVNSDNPYYNYYDYLPHRSYTNYSLQEIEDYYTNELYLDGKIQNYDDLNLDNANDEVNLSQFHGELKSFFGYEKIYGANAMMMLALSTHESAYGKSLFAYTKNNLFSHAAYDSEEERNAERYNNIDGSVYSHAKYYISRSYAGIHSSVYKGSFFGNKLSGMNANYSKDPYWGEKVASNYYLVDQALGYKDKNSYALAIINNKNFNVFNDESLNSLAFVVNGIKDYSFIILKEFDNVYEVQVDPSYSDEYLYNLERSVGYIRKNVVDYIIGEDKIEEKEYKTVHFDLADGTIAGKSEFDLLVLEDAIPSISAPQKDGYEFIGFDKELNKDETNYVAQYKKIEKIEVNKKFSKVIEYSYPYDLKGGKLKVYYEDGTNKVIDINTNMIEPYDEEATGETVLTINYCGVKLDYPVTISKELNETREKLESLISANIQSYKEKGSYDLSELNYIKENLGTIDFLTTFDEIRYIDNMLLENTRDKVNYCVKDSKYDVSISGLALSLKDPKPLSVIKPFKDTYYIEVGEPSSDNKERLSSVAEAYNFEIVDEIKVSVKYNLEKAKFDNPIIIQVKVPNKKQDKIYSVYHLDEDNNVVKCMTTQSENYISFMTRSEGDFIILTRDSVNTYKIADYYENISIHNSDPDNHFLFLEGGLLAVVSLLGFIMIIVRYILNKKKEKQWNVYKRSLQEVELLPDEKRKN